MLKIVISSMNWLTGQLAYTLGFGGLLSFYGIVGFLVYMLPVTTVSPAGKIVIVALVLLTLPFALLIGFIISRRAARRQAAADSAAENADSAPQTPEQPQKLTAPAATYEALVSGAEEVVQFLKSSNLGEGGKDAVYSLPWFIVAGAPRSGKSSLVLSSNFNFQTLPSQRQSEQKFIRPTANVDWRVTSDAVFVDTAGRYQTEGADADEWSALLDTVRKYRPKRPIDGFILTVNSETILKSDERQAEEIAKVLRSRLDEALQRLNVRFPVYLVFTNADAIEGFGDSFSRSKADDKALVWGSTFPLEQAENAQARFDGEFELLQESLIKRRSARLSAPFPPVRQLRIFNFPLHFASARRKFGAFVNALFRPNPFSENPLLRGFYFTAAPPARQSASAAPATVGTSYFTERFFRDVALRDRDLVKTFLAQRRRPPILGWALTAAGAIVVIALLTMAAISLTLNRSLLRDAAFRGEKVLTILKADTSAAAAGGRRAKTDDEIRRELNATDELRQTLVQLDDYEREGPPMPMRFGLYSGNQLYRKNLLPIYFGVIEQRFKTPTIKRVEAELRKFADSSPVANPSQLTEAEEQTLGKYYDLLKAYLMLSGDYKSKAEPTQIANALKDYWGTEAAMPADMRLTAQQQLDFWAKQVDRDDDDVRFPRITLDGKLVADTRQKLQAFPPVYRYYSRKVTEISKQVDDEIGPTTAEAILTRGGADTSFIEGTYSVPSAFTRPGFDLMKTAIAEADQKLSEDDWVMGETGKNQIARATDASRLQDRYFRDYADQWRNFVKGVNVKPYAGKDDAARALQAFSSSSSPLKILLREVARNTNLSARLDDEGWWQWIKSFFVSAKSTETGGSQPEKEFRPLFTFIGTKSQKEKAPVEVYQAEIGKLYGDFNGISEDRLKKISQEMADDKDPLKVRTRETAISSLLAGFNESASSQEVASLLGEPIGNLRRLLGKDINAQLAKVWSEQILPQAKEVEKGYPFDDGTADTDLTKLTAFLNPTDGKFSKFYDERLSKYFEESNGQLKLKDASEVKFTDEFIAYLNAAIALRKALFGTGAVPKFEYEFSLKPAKDAIIEVTIDGQKITSEGTGSVKGAFPAAGSAETGVQINLASMAAASAAAANSANSAVTTTPAPQTAAAGASVQRYPGNWGLFRFVDAGRPQKQPGGEYLLTYNLGGKAVTATIRPSGGDLFDKNMFRRARAPQSFMK